MADAETKAPVQIFIGKDDPESGSRKKRMKHRRLENQYEDELWSWTKPLAEGSWLFKSCLRDYMKDVSELSASGRKGKHVSRNTHEASTKGLPLKCLLRWTMHQPIRLRVTIGKILEASNILGHRVGSQRVVHTGSC